MEESEIPSKYRHADEASRIYLLPNLATAGNLFFGFMAIIRCIQARFATYYTGTGEGLTDVLIKEAKTPQALYEQAVWFIVAAVVCDALDGRLARLGGRESLFGKEFDSIADIVSFGLAPALMVFFLILSPKDNSLIFQQLGWAIGFIYLLCAGIRLARFNVITHPLIISEGKESTGEFMGLPVPAAAGVIASLVLVLNSYDLREFAFLLPILLLLIAFLMISNIPYPSFKKIDFKTRTKVGTFLGILILIVIAFFFRWITLSLLFLGYVFYGLIRHLRREGFHITTAFSTPDGDEKRDS